MAKSKSAGIVIYPEDIDRIKRSVKPQYQFAVIYALSRFAVDGTMPTEEELGEGGMVAFEFIFGKVKDALETFHANQQQRKEAIQKRWEKENDTDEYDRIRNDTDEYDRIRDSSKQKQKQKQKQNTETEEDTGKRTRRFTPPSVDEVRAYCQERGNRVDPQRFVDHYSSNGWKIGGRASMKDWKAAVRNWEGNDFNHGRDSPKADYARRDYTASEYNAIVTTFD